MANRYVQGQERDGLKVMTGPSLWDDKPLWAADPGWEWLLEADAIEQGYQQEQPEYPGDLFPAPEQPPGEPSAPPAEPETSAGGSEPDPGSGEG